MGTACMWYFIWDLGRIWAWIWARRVCGILSGIWAGYGHGYGHGSRVVLYLGSGPDMGTAGYGHGFGTVALVVAFYPSHIHVSLFRASHDITVYVTSAVFLRKLEDVT